MCITRGRNGARHRCSRQPWRAAELGSGGELAREYPGAQRERGIEVVLTVRSWASSGKPRRLGVARIDGDGGGGRRWRRDDGDVDEAPLPRSSEADDEDEPGSPSRTPRNGGWWLVATATWVARRQVRSGKLQPSEREGDGANRVRVSSGGSRALLCISTVHRMIDSSASGAWTACARGQRHGLPCLWREEGEGPAGAWPWCTVPLRPSDTVVCSVFFLFFSVYYLHSVFYLIDALNDFCYWWNLAQKL